MSFLVREVPAWSVENKCFSCHNNGDGARALFLAARRSHQVPPEALAATEQWLLDPDQWQRDIDQAEFKDGRLARIQFSAALLELFATAQARHDDKRIRKIRRALRHAAERLAGDQAADGQWPLVTGGAVPAPATYGPILATHFARNVLREADRQGYADHLSRSQRWLEQFQPASVLDASALLWSLANVDGDAAARQRTRSADRVRQAQGSDGGWGPYQVSSSEPFDTALALIALAAHGERRDDGAIRRGRLFLITHQQADGSWPATTRPAGVDSYAEYISTTAWALHALLATFPYR